jgi:hypothetical protein
MLPISEVALDELRVINGVRIALHDAAPTQLVKLRDAMYSVIQEEIAFRDNPRNGIIIASDAQKPDDRIKTYKDDIRAINGRLTSWRAYDKRQYKLPFPDS